MTRYEWGFLAGVGLVVLLALGVFGYHQRACLRGEPTFACDVARGFVRVVLPVRDGR